MYDGECKWLVVLLYMRVDQMNAEECRVVLNTRR